MEIHSEPEPERAGGHAAPREAPERWREVEPVAKEPTAKAAHPRRKRILVVLGGLAVIAALAWAVRAYLYGRSHETTDDATVQGHISPVLPRVDGYVQKVWVDDNQPVKEGALLVVIDPTPLRLAVQKAQAVLSNAEAAQANARAQLANAQAQLRTSEAQVRVAQVTQIQAAREARRQRQLEASHATPRKTYEDAQSAAAEASARLSAMQQQVAVAGAAVQQAKAGVGRADAGRGQAEAELARERLQLTYTELRAPISGRVSKKSVEPGQYVRPGAPVMAIADEQDTWVVANFKESQISGIHPGQRADIEVDAYSGHDFHGKVDSIAGATGSEFALLPEDAGNANFVKVEKRVPVKILFTDPPDPMLPLRPGLNVEAAVDTGS